MNAKICGGSLHRLNKFIVANNTFSVQKGDNMQPRLNPHFSY